MSQEKLMDKRSLRTSQGGLRSSGSGTSAPPAKRKRVTLNDLSMPPTDEELSNFEDIAIPDLPPKFKRDIYKRIFVNRDLRLDRITFFGFDMDYTLAIYNSPDFEELAYYMTIERLIKIGYPESIRSLKYDPAFPIRGLFLDKELGHLLKIDSFGNIIFCVHGKKSLTKDQIYHFYPSMVVHNEDIARRFYLLNTLFTIPEACLYADLVDHLENASKLRLGDEVSKKNEIKETEKEKDNKPHNALNDVSYSNLFQDVRLSMDFIHGDGSLKSKVLADLPKYIKKTPELANFLDRLRQNNRTSFLLTNSEFYYTDKVMSYLLNDQNPKYENWRQYWDIIIVGANKPQFFGEGSTLREIDLPTGNLKITPIGDNFERGKVYHGGSMSLFQKMTGAKGSKVLYTGDHIFADIIKSKKVHGWRNLVVVPELDHEIEIWEKNQEKYTHLINLEFIKAEVFRDLDSSNVTPPDLTELRKHIKQTNEEVNKAYNKHFGSLFRSGSKPSFFAMQVQRYADLYTSEYTNLLNYPLFYEFTANAPLLPHDYHPTAENLSQSMH